MRKITLDGRTLRCADLERAAREPVSVTVSADAYERCERSHGMLRRLLKERRPIYGVTTGFGENVNVGIDPSEAIDLQRRLIRFHGVGTGEPLSPGETRAVVLARLNTLLFGYSGVGRPLLDRLRDMINGDLLPVIPQLGSVGASGDLTPLSYLAAVVIGEREAWWKGGRVPSEKAWRELKVPPHQLQPKEALALMNGTSVMAAITAVGLVRFRRCVETAEATTAVALCALKGKTVAFEPEAHRLKPHPGQVIAAQRIRERLRNHNCREDYDFERVSRSLPDRSMIDRELLPFRLQDVYSLRCAPQILGAARDSITMVEHWMEIELNCSNDNPLFDPETDSVFSAGHFCGNHVVLGADALRNAAATVAELMDRQCLLLLDARRSGLPANLAPPEDLRRHGLKAVGIAMSALAAEIAHLAAPVAPHSRPTESMNQDVVSMGTIAARRLSDVVSLLERMAAMQLVVVSNALARSGADAETEAADPLVATVRGSYSPVLEEDRELDHEIESLAAAIRAGTIGGVCTS